MLKIALNRLKLQAQKIIAEEQAGFKAGRSTTVQISNLRILWSYCAGSVFSHARLFRGLMNDSQRAIFFFNSRSVHTYQFHSLA